ncbi:phenylalanine ammonium lyase [Amanita muscaria]
MGLDNSKNTAKFFDLPKAVHGMNGTTPVNGFKATAHSKASRTMTKTSALLQFLEAYRELEGYKNGRAIKVDGQTLSIAAVAAAARYNAAVELDESPLVKERVRKSQLAIANKVSTGASVYGLSTGFGGSADTRTDKPTLLGFALLQHQHVGILPTSTEPLDVLPLQDANNTSMPEAWIRGAILIRMNSLIRGHSGIRWELIEKMRELLAANVIPVVPLRGSISSSGDLSPLSYIAGTIIGNPSIKVYHGPSKPGIRQIGSSRDVLALHNIEPFPLESKEPLGILNGTAFSASVAALALNEAIHLVLLAQVCTAMGTEALMGTRASHAPFIHATARPHPGQVECAENIWNLLDGSKLAQLEEHEVRLENDKYILRQDRYPLRTSPQFLGPQIEDIISAFRTVTQECNSTTDNPLIDGETGESHHGGNFQAMAVTNAMEKTRLALHHVGKLLFSQSTELVNPAMNRGLPPSVAATDPSLNYHAKGLDIATAAYVAELGYLATPVSTHIQSAEMHNQAVNSLALISARATITSLEVLTSLIASYLYILCQALDLRALQREFLPGLDIIIREELRSSFGSFLSSEQMEKLQQNLTSAFEDHLDKTTTMDNTDRMTTMAATSSSVLLQFFTDSGASVPPSSCDLLSSVASFQSSMATRSSVLMDDLRKEYIFGDRGPTPASQYIGKTRPVYQFIRTTIGVRMHGSENYNKFYNGLGVEDVTIGQNISRIYESIRDGKMQSIIVSLFD